MPLYINNTQSRVNHPLMAAIIDNLLGPGGVPTTPAISIGPNAIPLDDEQGYLRKVFGSTMGDLGEELAKRSGPADVWGSKGYTYGGPSALDRAMSDPHLGAKIRTEAIQPGTYNLTKYPGALGSNSNRLDDLTSRLTNAFYPPTPPTNAKP